MFNVVLYEPEIPPNTGNIMRLCANVGCRLHLIEPLGFELDEKRLRRAGLDYVDWKNVSVYPNWQRFAEKASLSALWAFSTKATRLFSEASIREGDYLLFGPETRGLPNAVMDAMSDAQRLRIPMVDGSRSLNLSNAVAIALYGAWQQHAYRGRSQD